MARLSEDDAERARAWMIRASKRLGGAAAAASRKRIEEGEFDNNFDGTVSAIFHVVDAVELVRTGVHRRIGDDQEATMIQSVVLTLNQAGIPDVPAAMRLTGLNSRRNASVHGHWTEVLDREGLEEAVNAARRLHRAATIYIERQGVSLNATSSRPE